MRGFVCQQVRTIKVKSLVLARLAQRERSRRDLVTEELGPSGQTRLKLLQDFTRAAANFAKRLRLKVMLLNHLEDLRRLPRRVFDVIGGISLHILAGLIDAVCLSDELFVASFLH